MGKGKGQLCLRGLSAEPENSQIYLKDSRKINILYE